MRRQLALLLVMGALVAPSADAKKQKRPKAQDVTNYMLGIDYSHWMVGPVSFLASAEELVTYMNLVSDQDAEDFITEFWKRRDPRPDFFGNDLRRVFDTRKAEAGKRYREVTTSGWRTDRGTIYVIYGEPEDIVYETSVRPHQPTVEVWVYAKDAEPGLDSLQPRTRYWFAKKNGKTVRYTPRVDRRNTIRQ